MRVIGFRFFLLFVLFFGISPAAPVALDADLQIRLITNTTNDSAANFVRIAKDPRNDLLYYLKNNGDTYSVDLQPGSSSSSTGGVKTP